MIKNDIFWRAMSLAQDVNKYNLFPDGLESIGFYLVIDWLKEQT
jgi:hypothetical protein